MGAKYIEKRNYFHAIENDVEDTPDVDTFWPNTTDKDNSGNRNAKEVEQEIPTEEDLGDDANRETAQGEKEDFKNIVDRQ